MMARPPPLRRVSVRAAAHPKVPSRRTTLLGVSCDCTTQTLARQQRRWIENRWHTVGLQGSRRLCNSLLLMLFARPDLSMAAEELSQAYVDEDNGFVLTPPPRWARGSKGGAAVIFSDPEYKYNNLGVTVTPVKVATLQEFGAIEDAADRLLAFEKKKESTKSATLNSVSPRVGGGAEGGMTFYDFDYSLETTRGNKRVVSTVCISKNRLYIANGQYFCGEACADESASKLGVIKAALKTFALL